MGKSTILAPLGINVSVRFDKYANTIRRLDRSGRRAEAQVLLDLAKNLVDKLQEGGGADEVARDAYRMIQQYEGPDKALVFASRQLKRRDYGRLRHAVVK